MNRDPEPGSERLHEVLEACFLASEEGREYDLDALCEGDARLIERVRGLLAGAPAIVGSTAPRKPRDLGRIGDYTLLSQLGEGGMGTVFLAREESLGRAVALKVLRGDYLEGDKGRLRLKREAELMAALDHPGIVPVFAIGAADGADFIAMKVLSGPSLAELPSPPDAGWVANIGQQVAEALEVAHEAGVVHRDIKPSNILLDGERAVVVDFGLARSTQDPTLTRAGTTPGTLPYLAPELLSSDRRPMDPRGDVYALGVTLYELLAGRPPFRAELPQALMHSILVQDPPPLRAFGVHRSLAAVVGKALEKEPQRRYQSAGELAADLARFQARLPVAARPMSLGYKLRRLVRRNARASALTGVLLVAGGSAAAYAYIESERRQGLLELEFETARQALTALDLASAGEALARARGLGAEPQRLAAFEAELRQAQSREDLLDLVITRGALLAPGQLQTALEEFEASGARAREPRLGALLVALAEFHRGEDDAARAALAQLAPGERQSRAALAIAQLLEPEAAALVLPEPELEEAPVETLLVAVAASLTGTSSEQARRMLEALLEADSSNPRALLALASVEHDEGRYGDVLKTLRTIRGHELLERKRLRMEVAAHLVLGDLAAAQRVLQALKQRFGRLYGNEVFNEAALVHATQGEQAATAYLEPLLRQPQPEVGVLVFQAGFLFRNGEPRVAPEAAALLAEVLERPLDRNTRSWVYAVQYWIRAQAAVIAFEEGGAVSAAELEDLVEEGEAALVWLFGGANSGRVQHALADLEYSLGVLRGDVAPELQAARLCRRAAELNPGFQFHYQWLADYQQRALENDELDVPTRSAIALEVVEWTAQVAARLARGGLSGRELDPGIVRVRAEAQAFVLRLGR